MKEIKDVKIYGSEVKEGFVRPSFFVQLFVESNDLFSDDITENHMTVEIVYFGKEKQDLKI